MITATHNLPPHDGAHDRSHIPTQKTAMKTKLQIRWRNDSCSAFQNESCEIQNPIKSVIMFVRKGIRNSKCCVAPATAWSARRQLVSSYKPAKKPDNHTNSQKNLDHVTFLFRFAACIYLLANRNHFAPSTVQAVTELLLQ